MRHFKINAQQVPYRYYTSYCVLIKDARGNSLFSDTEAFFFFFLQVLRDLWFVRLPQLNQWRQWSCTAYGWKACQSPLEWAWHLAIRCNPAYLTLSRHKYFSRSLHPPWPAILCGCERSGLVRWKQYTVCWTTAGHWQLQVPKIHGQSCGARAPPVVEGYG